MMNILILIVSNRLMHFSLSYINMSLKTDYYYVIEKKFVQIANLHSEIPLVLTLYSTNFSLCSFRDKT